MATRIPLVPGQTPYDPVMGPLTQYDPGVFENPSGDFFVPQGSGYVFGADNPGAFGIGGKTPTPALSNPGGAFFDYGNDTPPDQQLVGAGGTPTIPPTAVATPASQLVPKSTAITSTAYKAPNTPNPSLVGDLFNVGADASNGFNGVTYAGFDPQNHQGAALGDPLNAKYALQEFLVNNPTMALSGGAPAIAQALNAKYGAAYGDPNFFTATDGETIMMPDGTYVHAAPNGYGMARGTYNAGNTGEVFWGASGSPATSTGPTPAPVPGPTPGPGPSPMPKPTGTGTGTGTGFDLGSFLTQFLQPGGAPSPSLPGGFGPPGGPLLPDLNQAGQDPLSQILDSATAGIIQTGGTPYGQSIAQTLADLIAHGGQTSTTSQLPSIIANRDAEAQSFEGMLSDARGQLADRGLVSQPGVPQGAEATAIDRISRALAPSFASGQAQVEQHGMDLANGNLLTALSTATGLSENDAANVLQAISLGGNRQTALANIALQTLDENRQWQQFLAQYGLNRDQIAAQIEQGDMTSVTQLLQLFLNSANTSASGFI